MGVGRDECQKPYLGRKFRCTNRSTFSPYIIVRGLISDDRSRSVAPYVQFACPEFQEDGKALRSNNVRSFFATGTINISKDSGHICPLDFIFVYRLESVDCRKVKVF